MYRNHDSSGYNPLLNSKETPSSQIRPPSGLIPSSNSYNKLQDDELPTASSYSPKNITKKETISGFKETKKESMDFEEVESVMWRKHQLRRFFQDRGYWWTTARKRTAWKWILVILIGILVGAFGAFVQYFTEILTKWRFETANSLIDQGNWSGAYFSYLAISLLLGTTAGVLCWLVPLAAGSGIPEIKSFLNGVNIRGLVRLRVLLAKVVGVCFSVSSGLPIGKEGPMVHIGSIVGAAISQGKSLTFGWNTSWTKFQDFRNDSSKRDFVTYGAAAGIAAAFRAPIGGVLFTLEEGASYWSTTITFRSFFCAMITMLTVSLIFAGKRFGRSENSSIFSFGQFDSLTEGKTNYFTYEIFVFALIGCIGGLLGSLFNWINKKVTEYRMLSINSSSFYRMIELLCYVALMATISFLLPLFWRTCTEIPAETAEYTSQERDLLDELSPFQCSSGQYNQLASLYFVEPDIALRQLFHYREYDGTDYVTFDTIPLLLFFVPYFLMAACVTGVFAPTGLFVPLIIAGSAYGRLWGHLLNSAFPGYVADSGTYALIGAAALLGGMARMTISGTVIMLEAAGNMMYLLPLMVTFGAARYTGNAINHGLYEIQIELQNYPFLPSSLRSLGLLNYYPVHEIMATPVMTLQQIEKVSRVYRLLMDTDHSGFPVVGKNGHLVGLILRKTLCSLLKLKAYSVPQTGVGGGGGTGGAGVNKFKAADVFRVGVAGARGGVQEKDEESKSLLENAGTSESEMILAPAATVFYDTLERPYPRYPQIRDIRLEPHEMVSPSPPLLPPLLSDLSPSFLPFALPSQDFWIDLRAYMDTAPYSINQSASVQRCYRSPLFPSISLLSVFCLICALDCCVVLLHRQFRTLGMRHMVVVDSDHKVVGMITRSELTEARLESHWHREVSDL
jgi:chloride channel 7